MKECQEKLNSTKKKNKHNESFHADSPRKSATRARSILSKALGIKPKNVKESGYEAGASAKRKSAANGSGASSGVTAPKKKKTSSESNSMPISSCSLNSDDSEDGLTLDKVCKQRSLIGTYVGNNFAITYICFISYSR